MTAAALNIRLDPLFCIIETVPGLETFLVFGGDAGAAPVKKINKLHGITIIILFFHSLNPPIDPRLMHPPYLL